MDVSVVIPTFNRYELLQQTLKPLLVQETTAHYDLNFISNGSTDQSTELLESVSREHPGKVTFEWIEPTGGPSAPRNRGIRKSKGGVVIILDDDVLPHTDLVERHWRYHLEHPEPEAAALGHVYVPDRLLDDPMSLFHTFPYHEVENQKKLDYLHFWTCNVSFKRDFMLENGMFSEDMLYFEDVAVAYMLEKHGMHLRYLPDARGEHLHTLKPSDIEKKGRFTGQWLYKTSKILDDVAFNRRFGIFDPRVGYPFLAWKALKRIGFRLTDNPITRAALVLAGAKGSKRCKASDFCNYLLFRRNMIAGYTEARAFDKAVGASTCAEQARY